VTHGLDSAQAVCREPCWSTAVCADSTGRVCCRQSLEAAVEAAAEVLNRAQRPAAIGGPMLKPYHGAFS
jgi:hypothetical protein